MTKKAIIFTVLTLLISIYVKGQSLVWEGSIDSDFFNEENWLIDGTTDHPSEGSINNNLPVDHNLIINDQELVLSSAVQLSFSSEKGLTLNSASFSLGSIASGYITLNKISTLILNSETPISDASINLESNQSWVKLLNVNPINTDASYLTKITSKGTVLVTDQNVIVNQYYLRGSIIRLNDSNYKPLTLFDDNGQSGDSFEVPSFEIYSRTQLGNFENKTSSFRLERGFMVNVAVFQNGTGKSEVYIASEEALEIDLPASLNNTVSFIRVIPWNWVTKKGASKFKNIGTTWTYNWNRNAESLPDIEYAPMAWGGSSAQSAVISQYIEKINVTHVMGFNESDNCNDQSGQYGDLCKIEVAVPLFKNLMKSGLRLVSPSPRENGPLPGKWLSLFRDLAIESDVRYDVLGVHWYDWASGPTNSPFEDPQKVFNRFKSYLDRVYAEHQIPIWITEFNANANRDLSVHQGFLELALPYLETLDFVERYDYFEPNPEVAGNREDITFPSFYDQQGNITSFGKLYRDFESTPAIPESTYSGSGFLSGLDSKIQLNMEINTNAITEGESLIISFSTDRSVAAAESFNIEVDLGDEQYTLETEIVEFSEGSKSSEVLITAVDDDLVEDMMNGTISLSNFSTGIEWSGSPISFSLESEDEAEVVLGVDSEIQFSLFPNPTQRFVHIDSPEKIRSVLIMSLAGKEVERVSYNERTLDLVNVDLGIYIVKVNFEDGRSIDKLIVKK